MACILLMPPANGFVAAKSSGRSASASSNSLSSSTTPGFSSLRSTTEARTSVQPMPAPSPVEIRSELRKLLARRSTVDDKAEILGSLSDKRRARGRGDPAAFDSYTDACLAILDEPRSSVSTALSKVRGVPSFRVNLLLLRRVMELTDSSTDLATRRNTLAVSLAQLRERRGVASLLREAERRTRNAASMDEMLSRTPEGLETPNYEVVERFGDWEVREYENFSVCSTTNVEGFTGFQTLAGYIFGKNKEEKKMAMTTPVFMTEGKMSFVMPSEYWSGDLDKAPTPMDDSSVVKETVEKKLVAALWYGGVSTKKEVAKRKDLLKTRIDGQDVFELGEQELMGASYNDPFTAPWKRRNEVLAVVKRK